MLLSPETRSRFDALRSRNESLSALCAVLCRQIECQRHELDDLWTAAEATAADAALARATDGPANDINANMLS